MPARNHLLNCRVWEKKTWKPIPRIVAGRMFLNTKSLLGTRWIAWIWFSGKKSFQHHLLGHIHPWTFTATVPLFLRVCRGFYPHDESLWKINGWKLNITQFKRKSIFQTSMFGFNMFIFTGCTFPETNITPENGWLEEEFWENRPIFRGYVMLGSGSHPTMIHLDQILDATDHHRDDSHPNVGCHSFPGDGDVLTSTRLDRTPFGVVENIRSGKIYVSISGM